MFNFNAAKKYKLGHFVSVEAASFFYILSCILALRLISLALVYLAVKRAETVVSMPAFGITVSRLDTGLTLVTDTGFIVFLISKVTPRFVNGSCLGF